MEPIMKADKMLHSLEESMEAHHKITKKNTNEIFLGVDVGTANVVSVAVDCDGNPITGVRIPARVTKEGMISDYIGAVRLVKKQIHILEQKIGCSLVMNCAMSAYPPQTESGNQKVTKNILEAADLEVIGLVDEPAAAAVALGIKEGIVVDVGGGTTGISVLEEGKILSSVDEPTGGFQMDLVIAGRLGIAVEEAEKMKRDARKQKELFPVIRPVMEKVAYIIKKELDDKKDRAIYLVGGSCAYPGFRELIEKETGRKVYLPENPLLVTPLGIALSCKNKMMEEKESEQV